MPSKPDTPEGKTKGKPSTKYTYSNRCTEPDGEILYYIWDWGDKNYSYWLGPYDSDESVEASYIWGQKGKYAVRVKTKDLFGGESVWSEPLPVEMPRSYTMIVPQLFEKLIDLFPNVFWLLRYFWGLHTE